MIHSKVMQMSDYDQMITSLETVDHVASLCGGWDPVQHISRRWEYAMMTRAYRAWLQNYPQKTGLRVADHGCGIGLSPAIMLYEGHALKMYEPWVYGDETAKVNSNLFKLSQHVKFHPEGWELIRRPLCELKAEDRGAFDIGLCISTLEHIGEYQWAWRDLLSTVKPGGLIFITTDFAEDQADHYQFAYLRAGRMFNKTIYLDLMAIARDEGFGLLDGFSQYDYEWRAECRLVNDYGYACLALVKGA